MFKSSFVQNFKLFVVHQGTHDVSIRAYFDSPVQ